MLEVPYSIKPLNPVPGVYWDGPWSSVANANANIPAGVRYQGMPTTIIIGGVAKNYHYRDGVADGDLIEFGSSGGSFASLTGAPGDNAALAAELATAVKLTGVQTIANEKTFSSPPVITSDPTAFGQAARKGYVDTQDNLRQLISEKNANNGYMGLGSTGRAAYAQLPVDVRLPKFLYASGNITNANNTTENIVFTQLIEAGRVPSFSRILFQSLLFGSGTANNRTIRIYANTVNNLSGSPVLIATFNHLNTAGAVFQRTMNVKSPLASFHFIGHVPVTASSQFDSLQGVLASTLDWGVDQHIIITMQNVTAADVFRLETLNAFILQG